MRNRNEILDSYRLTVIKSGEDGLAAQCHLPGLKKPLNVIASWGGGWEHVSVSYPSRCPTWEEMCMVKDIFWKPEEVAMQLHPAETEYVNNHPNCLHLWRPIRAQIPTPPSFMVGLRRGQTFEEMAEEARQYMEAYDRITSGLLEED